MSAALAYRYRLQTAIAARRLVWAGATWAEAAEALGVEPDDLAPLLGWLAADPTLDPRDPRREVVACSAA